MNDYSLLVFRGSEVKALGKGRVGGRLVVFDSRDQVGDVFTSRTDFFLENGRGRVPLLLEHGLHPQLKARRLGRADLTLHDDGLHILGELELTDAPSRSIYQMVEAGQLSWSSGSAPHLVNRTKLNDGTMHVDSWIIVESSLTQSPAEPRAVATALKSFAAHAVFADLFASPAPEQLVQNEYTKFLKLEFENALRTF